MDEIKPIAMPGTHQRFMKYFEKQGFDKELKILDLGAGHGAFTKKLHELGYNVSACDMFPEIFKYKEIQCKKVDVTKEYPYGDNEFDIVVAVEVSEHILDHETFFSEISRILKPEGMLLLSTPNVLSLKSRMKFLFKGFNYNFGPLDMHNYDGLQHVASLTLDQYNYAAIKNGFHEAEFDIDKKQSTSQWLLIFLFPVLWINSLRKKVPTKHNHTKLLLGRLLFLKFENKKWES